MLMKTDELGIPRFSNRDLIDMIYSGHADKVHVVLCERQRQIFDAGSNLPFHTLRPFLAALVAAVSAHVQFHASSCPLRPSDWRQLQRVRAAGPG